MARAVLVREARRIPVLWFNAANRQKAPIIPRIFCDFTRKLEACRAGAQTPSPTLTTVSYKSGNVAPIIIAVPVTVTTSLAGLLCSCFRRRRNHNGEREESTR